MVFLGSEGIGSGELRKEPCIVFNQETNVLDAPLNHGEAVEAHTECIASDLVRVVEAVTSRLEYLLEECRIYH